MRWFLIVCAVAVAVAIPALAETKRNPEHGVPEDVAGLLFVAQGGTPEEAGDAAAQLAVYLMKRNGIWQPDPFNWKIPTERGIRLEVKAVRSSKQTLELAIANMAAHCMGMLRGGSWHRQPAAANDSVEERVIRIVQNGEDPVIGAMLLVGLGSSQSPAARDAIVAATGDSHPGVRKTACYLVECLAGNYFGPIGNIHIGSPVDDVSSAGEKIRTIYRWDKTLGAGWGRMREGLQTRLVIDGGTRTIGTPVTGALLVRSVSETALTVPHKTHPLQYLHVLRDKKSVRCKFEQPPPPLPSVMILPGENKMIWSFTLDDWYDLGEPGKYEIWLSETSGALPPRSNRVQLTIQTLNKADPPDRESAPLLPVR